MSNSQFIRLIPKREITYGEFIRYVYYNRIKIDPLTPFLIKKLFKQRNARETPEVMEADDHLLVKYEETPIILISKKDGKLYYNPALTKDVKALQKQASIFLEMIRDIVEGYKRRNFPKKQKIVWT